MARSKLEIRMQRQEVTCCVCGKPTEWGWSVPTYNGDLVSNDFPDYLYLHGGGNQPACERCYDLHAAGQLEVCDLFYVLPGPLGVALIDGAGI